MKCVYNGIASPMIIYRVKHPDLRPLLIYVVHHSRCYFSRNRALFTDGNYIAR